MDEPLMRPTPGITAPKLSAEPLATEGEATPGDDDYVPYDDPEWQDDTPPAFEPTLPDELFW
jgi:hypothetical protein